MNLLNLARVIMALDFQTLMGINGMYLTVKINRAYCPVYL